MKNNKVIYVGPFSFPDGGAAARRILGISKSLLEEGYSVDIASGQLSTEFKEKNYEGVNVFSLNERIAEKYPKLLKNFIYFNMGNKTVAWLDKLDYKPKCIILYSGYSPYLLRLIPWCKKNNVKLIFDAVEWYQASKPIKALLSPYYWNIELAMRFLIPKTKNVITISSFLNEYYSSKGCNTVIVPPTLKVKENCYSLSVNNKVLTLGYTGSPGHKDLFENILKSIIELNNNGKVVYFKIAGVNEDELLNYNVFKKKNIKFLPEYIKTVGKVSQNEAIELIKTVDYSVLLRPNKKFAHAGFPTKLVESMSVGTPTITNRTSDIANYVKNEINGFIVDDFSVKSLVKCITVVLDKTEEERLVIRKNAYIQAKDSFDYSNFGKKLKNFIELN